MSMKSSGRKILIGLVALFAAMVLWLHVLTERTYEVQMKFSLAVIDLPQKYVLAEKVPNVVKVRVKGRGKDLLAQMVAGNEAIVSAKYFSYGKKKIVLGAENFRFVSSNLKLEEVISPKEISIHLDRKSKRNVPVASRLVIIPATGLIAGASPKFKPATVSIEGPESKVRNVKNVFTVAETLRGFNTNTSVIVPLVPPSDNVRPVPDAVTALIEVEPIAQKRIDGVDVELTDMPGRKGTIQPREITVIVTGAQSDVSKVTKRQIRAVVSYNDVVNVGTDKIKPTVICPQGIQVLSTEPEYVQFVQRKRSR